MNDESLTETLMTSMRKEVLLHDVSERADAARASCTVGLRRRKSLEGAIGANAEIVGRTHAVWAMGQRYRDSVCASGSG